MESRSRSAVAFALPLLFCAVGACGGGAKGATAPRQRAGFQHWYPLEEGLIWTYVLRDVSTGESMLLVSKVAAFDGTSAVLSQGDKTVTLRLAKDGIVREPSGAYLLKEPLTLGAKWKGANGATVEITKVDVKELGEAGTFEGCLETSETFGGDEARVTRTLFCPEVGPARIEFRSLMVIPGEVPPAAVARLRAFGVAGDLSKK